MFRVHIIQYLSYILLLSFSFLSDKKNAWIVQFIEKAPAEVVRGVREKASEAEEKISLTKNRLEFLQSTVSVAK